MGYEEAMESIAEDARRGTVRGTRIHEIGM